MQKEYTRNIKLLCPLCGSSNFEFDIEDENSLKRCIECNNTYSNKELREHNQSIINENMDDLKEQVLKDAQKDIIKSFRSAFKGFKVF